MLRQHSVKAVYGDPGRVRTYDNRLRRPVLYPAELRDQFLPPARIGIDDDGHCCL